MDLPLGQLIYTSFPGIGFRTLASAQVPPEIQQVFIQRVVSRYWDAYDPPPSGYRAVYLHQVTPEDCLFGWLYNDGTDEINRTHLPYFICYYLAEPLQTNLQLENVFTFLHRGPVALMDRQNCPSALETIVAPKWNYQPARPGVAIPSTVNVRSHMALKQGELLELFVPVNEQETVIDLSAETYEQQAADLSIYTRYLIRAIETGVVDLVDLEDTSTIKVRVIKPYQEYKKKLERYEQALIEALQDQYPINQNKHNSLKHFQQDLQLKNEDIELIEARIVQHSKKSQSQKIATGAIKNNEAVTVNAVDTYSSIITTLTQVSTLPINIGAHYNSLLAYKNSRLLLKAGIAATVLALFASIYGLLETSIFIPSQPDFISSTSSPVFYKTLAEVPNVPQGVFNYGGSTTFAPLRSQAIASAINQAHPQFQLLFTKPIGSNSGSGTGIKMLLAGELSFAQSSRPLKDTEFDQAKKRGFTLKQVPVAIDGVTFYVNPQVSIPGLSLSQVRDIFTGKITNWKAVGGPDLPITPFGCNPQSSGTVDIVKEKVLAGKEFSLVVQEVETTTESIRKVSTTPGGIGFATAAEVIDQKTIRILSLSKGVGQNFVPPFTGANGTTVNKTAFANGSYPLTRQLFIIIKQDGRLDEQVGSAYANLLLTEEGQQLVTQAGFVPIR